MSYLSMYEYEELESPIDPVILLSRALLMNEDTAMREMISLNCVILPLVSEMKDRS